MSVPRRSVQAPYQLRPHRRRSFDPSDSMALNKVQVQTYCRCIHVPMYMFMYMYIFPLWGAVRVPGSVLYTQCAYMTCTCTCKFMYKAGIRNMDTLWKHCVEPRAFIVLFIYLTLLLLSGVIHVHIMYYIHLYIVYSGMYSGKGLAMIVLVSLLVLVKGS